MAGFSRPSHKTETKHFGTNGAPAVDDLSPGSVSTDGSIHPHLQMAKEHTKKNSMSLSQLTARLGSALSWRASRRTRPPRSPSWSTR
uniref:Uncharacterized protein n=1 Tax=Arundo donax TaxID=35708 RepID=A0A0A8XW91_ARUDO